MAGAVFLRRLHAGALVRSDVDRTIRSSDPERAEAEFLQLLDTVDRSDFDLDDDLINELERVKDRLGL